LIDQLELTSRCLEAESKYLLKHPVPDVTLAQLQSKLDAKTAYIGWLDAKCADQQGASTGPFLHARWMYVVTHSGPIRWIPVWENKTRDDDARAMKPISDWNAIMTRSSAWRERLQDDAELAERSRGMYRAVFGDRAFDLPGVTQLVTEV